MSTASEDPKKRKAVVTLCSSCGKEVAGSAVHEECTACGKFFCRVCCGIGMTRHCASARCTVTWCLVDFVRAGNRCMADALNDDYTHVGDEEHGLFCGEHAARCVRCKVALCNEHNAIEKKTPDWYGLHTKQCGRCSETVCGACSVECTQCEERECLDTCEKIGAWEQESGKTSQDYFCQPCRHRWRREGDEEVTDSE